MLETSSVFCTITGLVIKAHILAGCKSLWNLLDPASIQSENSRFVCLCCNVILHDEFAEDKRVVLQQHTNLLASTCVNLLFECCACA